MANGFRRIKAKKQSPIIWTVIFLLLSFLPSYQTEPVIKPIIPTKEDENLPAARPASREDRRDTAKSMLKEAAEKEGHCEKGTIYEQIVAEYGDLPEARFAKNNMTTLRGKVEASNKKIRKIFASLTTRKEAQEEALTKIITGDEDFIAACDADFLKKLVSKDLEYYQNYRLKNFGY